MFFVSDIVCDDGLVVCWYLEVGNLVYVYMLEILVGMIEKRFLNGCC